jgi:hypothetical protein
MPHLFCGAPFARLSVIPWLVHSGLLVEKTGIEAVLRDAGGQTIRIALADIELMETQPTSLMPEQLLREMTASQAADLLEYLATRKKVEGTPE